MTIVRACNVIFSVILCLGIGGCTANSSLLIEGDITRELKRVELMQPLETDAQYLGIEDGDSFSPATIDADILVIHFFSMYCPKCQSDAAVVNEFYDLTLRPHLDAKIKIIGIGFANSEFEVAIFKRKFNVPFPLFPDIYGDAARELQAYTTPHFIVAKRTNNGKYTRVYQKAGAMGNSAKFFKTVLAQVN